MRCAPTVSCIIKEVDECFECLVSMPYMNYLKTSYYEAINVIITILNYPIGGASVL